MWKPVASKLRQQHATKKFAYGHPNSWKMQKKCKCKNAKFGHSLQSSPRNSSNSVISNLTRWFILLAICVETVNSNSNMNVPIKFEIHSQKQQPFLVCLYPDLEFEFTSLQKWISENERFSCSKCGYEFHIVIWWLSCDKIDTGQYIWYGRDAMAMLIFEWYSWFVLYWQKENKERFGSLNPQTR